MSRHAGVVALIASGLFGCAAAQKSAGPIAASTSAAPTDVVDQMSPFRAVLPIGDRVYLAAAEPRDGSLATDLSLNGKGRIDTCEAKVGDSVAVGFRDLLGTGSCIYEVIAVSPDVVTLRENTWFYDVVPETHQVIHVRPYGVRSP